MESEVEELSSELESEQEIYETLIQVEETARLKSELLVNVTQELRSSLSLLQQPISEIKAEASQDQQSSINKLLERVGRLRQIIEQLGDVGKLPVRHGALEVTEVELCSFLRRYTAFFESKADQKNVGLQAQLPDYEVVQTLDPDKLEEILIILLSNAIRFTPQGGDVIVSLHDASDYTRLVIHDTGPGMNREEVDTLFYDPDVNAEADTEDRKQDDIGIRLSIVKKLVELHDGEITVESEIDEGTTFTLTFPKHSQNVEKAKSHHMQNMDEMVEKELSLGQLSLLEGPLGGQATILVVEDNRNMRDYMVALLSKEGLNIEVAENGREALKQLAVVEPDLIISDIMMPEMDGFEFVEKLRSDPQNQLIPVIMISAKAEEEARIHGFHIGISDYLVKPFSEPELKARVQNLLRQKLEREKYLTDDEKQEAETHEQSLVERLKEYIERRIKNETITIRELSQSVNTSRRQLYRDLKAYTGFTPAEFVREVKLRKARHLLEQSSKATVAEVAHEVGYNTAAHFSKIFKKRFGRNPSEYK